MATIILALIIVGIAFALIAVRVLFIKGGEFRGTCSTNNPFMKQHGIDCSMCSAKSGGICEREEAKI